MGFPSPSPPNFPHQFQPPVMNFETEFNQDGEFGPPFHSQPPFPGAPEDFPIVEVFPVESHPANVATELEQLVAEAGHPEHNVSDHHQSSVSFGDDNVGDSVIYTSEFNIPDDLWREDLIGMKAKRHNKEN